MLTVLATEMTAELVLNMVGPVGPFLTASRSRPPLSSKGTVVEPLDENVLQFAVQIPGKVSTPEATRKEGSIEGKRPVSHREVAHRTTQEQYTSDSS